MRVNKETTIWFTIYADLITNLMLFFMAAFIITRFDKEMQQKVHESISSGITGSKPAASASLPAPADIAKEMQTEAAGNFSKVEINEKRINITLPGEVLFESGSATLNTDMKRTLDKIASVINKSNNPIIVAGHTDDIPLRGGSNWQLSLSRAISVVDYFVDYTGVPRTRFMVAGYGEYKPLVSNTSNENRIHNRRIELTVLHNE